MSDIEITPELLSELRQKAEAASPGPWSELQGYVVDPNGFCVYHFGSHRNETTANQAYLLAASPDVVLALVSEIEYLWSGNYL